jgi:ABC-type Na+ efflux pump permease subunit
MTPKKETVVEDSPVVEKKVVETKPETKTVEKPKKTFWQIILPWVIVALVCFLGGAALIYFTLYTDVKTELASVKVGSNQLMTKLSAVEIDLQKATNDLASTQASLTEATTALTKAETLEALYKFQADANAARAALLDNDPASARIIMTKLTEDLATLQATEISADLLSGIQPRLDTALQNLETEPRTAIDALDTLSQNLDVIATSLK